MLFRIIWNLRKKLEKNTYFPYTPRIRIRIRKKNNGSETLLLYKSVIHTFRPKTVDADATTPLTDAPAPSSAADIRAAAAKVAASRAAASLEIEEVFQVALVSGCFSNIQKKIRIMFFSFTKRIIRKWLNLKMVSSVC